jgi:hypothetical protein
MAKEPREVVRRQLFFSEPPTEEVIDRPQTKLSFDLGKVDLDAKQLAGIRNEAVRAAMAAAAKFLGRDDFAIDSESFSTFSTFSTFSSAA